MTDRLPISIDIYKHIYSESTPIIGLETHLKTYSGHTFL